MSTDAVEMRPESNGTPTGVGEPIADKSALLADVAFAITPVPLPSGRGTVMVKPLSRAQAMALYGRELSARDMECEMLAGACVNPRFTVGEVKVWQERDQAGQDIMALVDAIMELSGMEIGAGKAAYKQFRG